MSDTTDLQSVPDAASASGITRSPEAADLMAAAVKRNQDAGNERTQRTYRAGWEAFKAFADRMDFDSLPAPPEGVVMFLEDLAQQGYAPNTLDTYLTAVSVRHVDAGHSDPTKTKAVKRQRKNLRRTTDHTTSKRAPVLLKHLKAMPFEETSMGDLRDRALLLIGFAGGFRRSELVGLRRDDVQEVEGGITIRVGRSKTDQEGRGTTKQIPNRVPALNPTPNEALRAWLDAAGITSGPIFRPVDRWGNVREGALSGNSVYRIVRARMETIGKSPDAYGAHSLRAGYVTQGYMNGIGEHEIAAQTGHRKLDTLRGYQRVTVVMENHPLSRMTADPVETVP